MIYRKDAINLASQLGIKLVSVPYSLIMIGTFVRHLPSDSEFLLLSVPNYIAITGLAQLGLGGFLLRRISHTWAEHGDLGDLPEIRGGFWLSAALAFLTAITLIILAVTGNAQAEVLPVLILSLIGLVAIVGDYVRIAMGDIVRLNVIVLALYVLGGALAVIFVNLLPGSVELYSVIAFGPAYVASIASFLLLLRRPDFRRLFNWRGNMIVSRPLREGIPILLTSLGFAAILNIPLASQIFPAFPELPKTGLACIRLFSNGLNVFFFALQPLIPIILRVRYRNDTARAERFTGLLLLSLIACASIGAVLFWLIGPSFIRLWLGDIVVSAAEAQQWGIVAFLWLTITILVFFCQATSRPFLAAASLLVAAGGALIVGLLGMGWTVTQVMTIGLALGVSLGIVSAALAATDPRRSPVRHLNTAGPPQ